MMWQIIRDLVAGGVTVLLTTQYLEEADELADRIAVLDQGRLVAEGTAGELKRLVPGRPHQAAVRRPGTWKPPPQRWARRAIDDESLTLQVPSDGSLKSLRSLLDRLDDDSIEVEGLTIHSPDLDDVFFALTGKEHAR